MRQNTNGAQLVTFIMYKEQFAGSLSVVSFNKDNRSCEIGYWLSEKLQGRGIMTATCRAFVQYLFQTKAINRIEIKVATGNHKSQGIPKRLGFIKEGILRQGLFMYGSFTDVTLYSLLRDEWAAKTI